MNRRNTCVNSSAIRDSLLIYSIEVQNTDGSAKTSTIDVIARDLLSPYLRFRVEMWLEVIPRLSGNLFLLVSVLVIVKRCCSICLPKVTSPTNEQEKRYSVTHSKDLVLVVDSYMLHNHSMKDIAGQTQITLIIISSI